MAANSVEQDPAEPRILLTALGPDGFKYEVTVAMRGMYARDWDWVNVLGFVVQLLMDKFIGPRIGRKSPARKVSVFRGYRDWRPVRKRYRAWFPDPDRAFSEAQEICREIERGHLRWRTQP